MELLESNEIRRYELTYEKSGRKNKFYIYRQKHEPLTEEDKKDYYKLKFESFLISNHYKRKNNIFKKDEIISILNTKKMFLEKNMFRNGKLLLCIETTSDDLIFDISFGEDFTSITSLENFPTMLPFYDGFNNTYHPNDASFLVDLKHLGEDVIEEFRYRKVITPYLIACFEKLKTITGDEEIKKFFSNIQLNDRFIKEYDMENHIASLIGVGKFDL